MLYFASSSKGRKQLLDDAGILYKSIKHTSDEIVDSNECSVEEYTACVARMKMNHIDRAFLDVQYKTVWVLVADTMVQALNGEILGNLEPIFPENLGYDLKDFVAGEIPLFPAAFDPRAIKVFTKKRDYKPIYILILFITLILSVISTILISKLLSKSSQSDEEIY